MKTLLRMGLVLTLISTQFVFAQVVEITQELDWPSGYTFVSTRIDMDGQSMFDVFGANPSISHPYLTEVRNELGAKFWKVGPNWVNNIGDWETIEGYLVGSTATDGLTLSGQVIDVTTPITVDGINFVSYLPFDELDAEVAYATIMTDDLQYVRNSDGNMLRKIGPNWVNGIGNCIPGDGYYIRMDTLTSDVLTYPFYCGDAFTDSRDDKVYLTVQIGDQCWMAENLNVGDTTNLQTGGSNFDGEQTNNDTIEKYCYQNTEDSCTVYGGLYQWDEMMQYVTDTAVQGICPSGWHLPTDFDWYVLEHYVDNTITAGSWGMRGTDAGGDLKEKEYLHWNSPNTGADDTLGFTALGGGTTSSTPSFINIKTHGEFWTSNGDGNDALFRSLRHNDAKSGRYNDSQSYGKSVRCIKDAADNKSSKRPKNSNRKLLPKHFIVEFGDPSQNIWTIYIDKGEFEIGDEIGVYFGEILAGSGVIQSDIMLENAIPIFSNIYKTGNEAIIKIWDKSLEKEFVINNFSYANPYGNAYSRKVFPKGDMEYTLINSVKFEKSSVIEMEKEISINPNPSEGIFNLSLKGYSGNIQLT